MWFKNLSFFRLLEPINLDRSQIEAGLSTQSFCACGSLEPFSMGWVSPLGPRHVALSHVSEGRILLTLQREEKVLPASSVKDRVNDKVADILEREDKVLGRKAREAIRDEVLQDMLPKAFTQKQSLSGYIDTEAGWLVVDTVSARKAEDFVALLRKSWGTFSVKPFATELMPSVLMTDWVKSGETPSLLTIEMDCELKSEEKEGSVIRCQRQAIDAPEIRQHLDAGKIVTKMALSFDDRLGFVLSEDWVIRKLKFLDLIQEESSQHDDESDEARFDVDFSLMTREINRMVNYLSPLFGGAPK